jgi:glycosyltransferase involved in cell wall biosynthesis
VTVTASVVIPALNAEATLGQQLTALAAQVGDVDFEVLVVDNGSRDGTVQVVHEHADRLPGLRVLSCPRPGANAARNTGLAEARGDVVLFCDADDEVDAAWVAAMTASLQNGSVLVAGRIDDLTLNTPEAIARTQRYPPGTPVVARFLPRGIGANLGVRAEAARSVGGFNEAYHYGATDTEFCWRLQLAGHALDYCPDAVVRYRLRPDLGASVRRAYPSGQARAQLYRDFRASGMPRSRVSGALRRWAVLVVTAGRYFADEETKAAWLREVYHAAGRVKGSVKFRVLYL